jgi:UDP-N-acetyl-D-glucosamine dehydrogenase
LIESVELGVSTHASRLRDRIHDRTARVGVVGIGHVGLPVAVEKARAGYSVVGFDTDDSRVEALNAGVTYLDDVDPDELARAVAKGSLRASSDFAGLGQCDVIAICVPTALTANKDPDVSRLRRAAEAIAFRLRPGQLIALECTTYPGTTEELLLPILTRSGLAAGEDFYLCYAPKGEEPAGRRHAVSGTKVVSGVTPRCREVAQMFYGLTSPHVLTVSSPRAAEMTKVFESTFRAVNGALVNELALLCDRMGIDVWEVVDAASTDPFGVARFDPGPGVGGRDLPFDPFYLAWKARQYDFPTRFIELAGEINARMPYFVVEKLGRILNERGRSLRYADVLVIGVASEKDGADWRGSPSLKVIELLERAGASVKYFDPHVESFVDGRGTLRRSVALDLSLLGTVDCTVILTDHSGIPWERVVESSPAVLDTRNATAAVSTNHHKIVRL